MIDLQAVHRTPRESVPPGCASWFPRLGASRFPRRELVPPVGRESVPPGAALAAVDSLWTVAGPVPQERG